MLGRVNDGEYECKNMLCCECGNMLPVSVSVLALCVYMKYTLPQIPFALVVFTGRERECVTTVMCGEISLCKISVCVCGNCDTQCVLGKVDLCFP